MKKYKFEIETIATDKSNKFKSYVSFCGVPKKYIFTTIRTIKPDSCFNKTLSAKNFYDSDYLEEHEITEENLKKFHLIAIEHFDKL